MTCIPGDWICPNCGPILNECVTFQETCTHCYHPVFWAEETHELISKKELAHLRNVHDDLVAALDALRAYAIPGMNWTDEVRQALLDLVDKALGKAKERP